MEYDQQKDLIGFFFCKTQQQKNGFPSLGQKKGKK
jgi:hypothetical protein